jgi:hypothetical protein
LVPYFVLIAEKLAAKLITDESLGELLRYEFATTSP